MLLAGNRRSAVLANKRKRAVARASDVYRRNSFVTKLIATQSSIIRLALNG